MGLTLLISFYAFSNRDMLYKLIMNPYQINNRNQYYRFVSSGFIHNDHMHLLMNMFSLYFFGQAVEYEFLLKFDAAGGFYFVVLYLMAIVVSDIPTFFKNRNNPAYNSLGASGGVAAVIFAFIILRPLDKICLYLAICMPGFILGTLYLVYSYYSGKKSKDNINHDAHLYGALFGLIFCVVLYPPALKEFFVQVSNWQFFR